MPRPTDSAPCGSKSTSRTLRPYSASAAPRLIVVVVLPTPPFWLQTATTRAGPCVMSGSGSGSAGMGRPVGPCPGARFSDTAHLLRPWRAVPSSGCPARAVASAVSWVAATSCDLPGRRPWDLLAGDTRACEASGKPTHRLRRISVQVSALPRPAGGRVASRARADARRRTPRAGDPRSRACRPGSS